MGSTDLVLRLIRLLHELQIPYMLVGSYSSNLYGRPRSTKDADFVLQLSGTQLAQLQTRVGPDLEFDPQATFETVTMTTRYVLKHPASAFKIELFMLSSDAHDQERFRRRQVVDFEGQPTWLPTAEDVVITKLRWSVGGKRSKDVDDVEQVLQLQRDRLDLPYIRGWCDRHGTRQLFERLLAETHA